MHKFTALFLCFIALPSFADTLICQGQLRNKNINADLVVEKKCILDNAKINGNIEIKQHGSLVLKRSQVSGNIQADAYFSGIQIEETHVAGNIQLAAGREIMLKRNQVEGEIDLQNNLGVIQLEYNRSQALLCVHNRIAPLGAHNQASSKLAQCQTL